MERSHFKSTIESAIANEAEAQAFYADAANRVESPYIRDLFSDLADEERRHQRILEQVLARGSIERYFTEDRDYGVAETIGEPKLSTDMKPADAIALAAKKEEQAMKHYTALAESCTDPDTKDVFLGLASMEREHKLKLEGAFVDIGYPEVW